MMLNILLSLFLATQVSVASAEVSNETLATHQLVPGTDSIPQGLQAGDVVFVNYHRGECRTVLKVSFGQAQLDDQRWYGLELLRPLTRITETKGFRLGQRVVNEREFFPIRKISAMARDENGQVFIQVDGKAWYTSGNIYPLLREADGYWVGQNVEKRYRQYKIAALARFGHRRRVMALIHGIGWQSIKRRQFDDDGDVTAIVDPEADWSEEPNENEEDPLDIPTENSCPLFFR